MVLCQPAAKGGDVLTKYWSSVKWGSQPTHSHEYHSLQMNWLALKKVQMCSAAKGWFQKLQMKWN